MADDEDDVTEGSVVEVAQMLGITARRVRQLREDGDLVKRGPGKLDMTHASLAHLGRRCLEHRHDLRPDRFTAAGVGWLLSHRRIRVGAAELEAWYKAAARWGLDREAASGALMAAASLLGDRCPQFDMGRKA